MNAKECCPICGSLPCDWVDDPHETVRVLRTILAELEFRCARDAGSVRMITEALNLVPVLGQAVKPPRGLVSAAPDLLEAIKCLLPEGWGDDGTMDHMRGVKAARLAIAKAEGLTPGVGA